MPETLSLQQVLDRIDRIIGIDTMLADQGRDLVAPYYAQSRIAYDRLHSGQGCMHVALNPDGVFHRAGYKAQPRRAGAEIRALRARRVLELGAGMGFNTLYLAPRHPGAEFVALDLLAPHVAEIERRARDRLLSSVRAVQGSYDSLPHGLGRFEVIFAVETLCYAADPDRVAAGIAAHLAPGGRVVIFDPFAARPEAALTPAMAQATRLYRLGVALTRELTAPDRWWQALTAAGLRPLADEDLTLQAAPGLLRLQQQAWARTEGVLRRLALRALPPYLLRNLATALTGPFVCFGPQPDAANGPDTVQRSVSYRCLIAERPAGA